ncbi:MAG: hypothetical protein V5A30_02425 [Haloarculaceae archaeon]
MDRLSSCYFCGTALDEPLQDYPLVAGDTGEHGAVVTLCPGCHHKLETVLDVVVGEGEDLPALEDADRVALEGESPAALTEPEEGEDAPDPIALGDGKQDDSEGERGANDVDSASGADRMGPGDGTDDDSSLSEAATADEPNRDEAGEESPATDGADPAIDTGPDTSGSGDGVEPPTAGGEETTGRTDDATTAGDTAAEGERGTDPEREVTATVSALEYNKVMRLLQNREFPVDRAEIETIATSAYDLSERECAAVIDLAVDRGLVVERDGQLVRPDG